MSEVQELSADWWNFLAADIHANDNHKWWHDEQGNFIEINPKKLNILIVSELSEAMEGFRKDLMDDKLPHRPMVEVELADAVIRRLDKMMGLDENLFDEDYEYEEPEDGDMTEYLWELVCGLVEYEDDAQCFVYQIMDIGMKCGYDIIGAIHEKREFNQTRQDHTREARAAVGGKKF